MTYDWRDDYEPGPGQADPYDDEPTPAWAFALGAISLIGTVLLAWLL